VGWGEAAPLPGFSRETLGEASRHLQQQAEQLAGRELTDSVIDDALRRHVDADSPPSVQFAVASAITELWADRREMSVPAMLGGGAGTVPLNALIYGDDTDFANIAERYREAGFRAVKLKVGRRTVEEDVARVQELAARLGEDVALRLDANRAWTFEQAIAFAERLEDVSVEYVEEPLEQPDRLSAFAEATGLPVAIDETTREIDPGALGDVDGLAAVILKPTMLGGIRHVRRWVIHTLNEGAAPVFSAAYESGVGTRMLVALASVLSDAPAGLSTYTRLKADVLTPRLSMDGAEVSVDDGYAATVDQSQLHPLGDAE
jgi:O-succinylbenzoate synthase